MTHVLLLHAGIADRRMWAPQVAALEAAGHSVDAPDLPGYGEAALEPGELSYVDVAASRLGGPAAVVGCSFGGRIALELAFHRRELVERLALVGAGLCSRAATSPGRRPSRRRCGSRPARSRPCAS